MVPESATRCVVRTGTSRGVPLSNAHLHVPIARSFCVQLNRGTQIAHLQYDPASIDARVALHLWELVLVFCVAFPRTGNDGVGGVPFLSTAASFLERSHCRYHPGALLHQQLWCLRKSVLQWGDSDLLDL